MKVKMLKTTLGSDTKKDGTPVAQKPYEKDQVYEVSEHLGKSFLNMKVAEQTSESPADKKAQPKSNKNAGRAPENKSQKDSKKDEKDEDKKAE